MIERLPIQLIEFFQQRAAAGEMLALITVLDTEGSTYSKAGSQMLVDAAGDFQGMLSGGCLEGDLAERAKRVMASGEPLKFSYDLRTDDDVFGFAVGCEGIIHVFIQPLSPTSNYVPYAGLLASLNDNSSAELTLADGDKTLGVATVLAPLKLLILGAGLDVDPVALFARALGWKVMVSDHRPAAIDRMTSLSDVDASCVAVDDLRSSFDLNAFDAVIIMSHNLNVDRAYLKILVGTTVSFVGLLGPPHRRDRLLREIGDVAANFGDRLRAPVGKQIGGRGPAAIALEIVADLQARFSTNDQNALSESRSPGTSTSQ